MTWSLPSTQDPRWRLAGWGLLAFTSFLTTYYLWSGPKSLGPSRDPSFPYAPGIRGTDGTLVEGRGPSRLTLRYKGMAGQEEDLQLTTVTGLLEEPQMQWTWSTPGSRRRNGVWILAGPMDLEARRSEVQAGQGCMDQPGDALRFEEGLWTGLQPLRWESREGAAQGLWRLPAGWRREEGGDLVVEQGPVTWEAQGPGSLRALEAQTLRAAQGFQQGRLDQVRAHLEDGDVEAQRADLAPEALIFPGPLTFRRQDGWNGKAEGGRAPRPPEGQSISRMELRGFQARRGTPQGEERLGTQGVRWTPAGLRLEGSVLWEQPLERERLKLTSSKVLIREGTGEDLPADLPLGQARAEGQPLLAWGRRNLASPRMDLVRSTRQWTLAAPVTGRSEEGSFSAGAGKGDPRAWSFQGPVVFNLARGGTLRGASLRWEESRFTLEGRPATWTRLRERLQGSRILRSGDRLDFPDGLSGTLAGTEGDLSVRAGRGESDPQEVRLTGGVECAGEGWRLLADRMILRLGPGRVVQTLLAEGRVSLRGRLGEGQGDALEMEPGLRKVKWQGKVRGLGSAGN